ncbi:exodeoxyribonuclease III [Yasminevirus sp. GU-2018]|uniref:Exodeoxyribonuclease III n=1 Tax=Yasminevirus sp. GU-2018 TaxID=2420051 RepID=A0A5K0U8M2_9VIRU|nr:exodeoxyribonuclease III [Yasminevirus sp. GU-2018]
MTTYAQNYEAYLNAVNEYNRTEHKFYSGEDVAERIAIYSQNCERYASKVNSLIPKKDIKIDQKRRVRIMSWNVRYWTDSSNKQQITNQVNLMIEQSPDIICLQEATWGAHEKYTDHHDYDNYNTAYNKLLELYDIVGFCSATPSWYASSYGNMVLILKEFAHLCQVNKDRFASSEYICDALKGKCFFNQYIQSYDNVPEKQSSSRTGQTIQFTDITNEVKCFIKISLFNFDILCVHLDAYKVEYRLEQIKQLKDNITRPTIIVGDFNCFNTRDFLDLESPSAKTELDYHVSYRQKRGGDDQNGNREFDEIRSSTNKDVKPKTCPDLSWNEINKLVSVKGVNAPVFSQWSGTRVDFSFVSNVSKYTGSMNKDYSFTDACSKSGKFLYNFYVYYLGTNLSDHIPMLIDVDDYALNAGIRDSIGTNSNTGKKQTIVFKTANQHEGIVYNNQPLDGYDWLRLEMAQDTKTKKFKFGKENDPFLTGNSNMALGNYGVYVTNHTAAALNFGSLIKKNLTFTKDEIGRIKKIVSLLFCFKQVEVENIRMGLLSEINAGDINYYPSLQDDNRCHTYVGRPSGLGTIITKYTRRALSTDLDEKFETIDQKASALKDVDNMIKVCRKVNTPENINKLKTLLTDNNMSDLSDKLVTLTPDTLVQGLNEIETITLKKLSDNEAQYRLNSKPNKLDRTDIVDPQYYLILSDASDSGDVEYFVEKFNSYPKTPELEEICKKVVDTYRNIKLITDAVSDNSDEYTAEDLIKANIYIVLRSIELINSEKTKTGYMIKVAPENFVLSIDNMDDDDEGVTALLMYKVDLNNVDLVDSSQKGGTMFKQLHHLTKMDYFNLIRNF